MPLHSLPHHHPFPLSTLNMRGMQWHETIRNPLKTSSKHPTWLSDFTGFHTLNRKKINTQTQISIFHPRVTQSVHTAQFYLHLKPFLVAENTDSKMSSSLSLSPHQTQRLRTVSAPCPWLVLAFARRLKRLFSLFITVTRGRKTTCLLDFIPVGGLSFPESFLIFITQPHFQQRPPPQQTGRFKTVIQTP